MAIGAFLLVSALFVLVRRASDVVIRMGCRHACPFFPGKPYLDSELADAASHGVNAVRPIRDEIHQRVRGLLAELHIPVPA